MMVTEEEAKTKRCQEGFGPPVSEQPTAFMMGVGITAHTAPMHCIASACMAWRWSGTTTSRGAAEGFCGKAGMAYKSNQNAYNTVMGD